MRSLAPRIILRLDIAAVAYLTAIQALVTILRLFRKPALTLIRPAFETLSTPAPHSAIFAKVIGSVH
jgi:hypothetical protein